MKTRIFQTSPNSHFISTKGGDCINVNPFKYYQSLLVQGLLGIKLETWNLRYPLTIQVHKILLKEAVDIANERISEFQKHTVDPQLILLLQNPKKNKAATLAKRLSLTAGDFRALPLVAYRDFGYLLSSYFIEHEITGDDPSQFPAATYYNESTDELIHSQNYNPEISTGRMKRRARLRNSRIIKILENDQGWLCFFTTYASLKGKEKHRGGNTPHYHFLSDKWGFTREEVLERLSQKKYSLPSIHVGYVESDKRTVHPK